MSNILHLSKDINNEDLEKFLAKIYTSEIDTLSIVKHPSDYKFGITPMLLQVISTLFLKNDKIKVLIKDINITDIEDISKKIIYLSAIMRSNFLINKNEEQLQKEYVKSATIFLNNMNYPDKVGNTFKGIGTQYICFDWSKHYSYIDILYNNKKLILKEDFIEYVAPNIFRHSISKSAIWDSSKHAIKFDFSSILYELFQNTELHTRDNSFSRKSIRGFILKYLKIQDSEYGKYGVISNYLEQKKLTTSQFLEMSVFDTGEGLAKSISDVSNFSFSEEINLVQKCFNKHVTRSNSKTRGIGLFEVVKLINKYRGLFILRTGRILLQVDSTQIKIEDDKVFFQNLELKEHQEIIGTSYTILLPLVP